MWVLEMIAKVDELKHLILHNLDVMAFLDIIGKDLSDLVEVFDDEIDEFFDELMKAVE